MKIVILDGYTTNPGDTTWEELAVLGDLTVHDRTDASDVAQRIGDAEVVYTNKTPITRETMAVCPNLRYIGVLATGYNIVDVDAAKERGIPVCNAPAYATNGVAQFTFAHLLEVCHHVGHHAHAVTQGEWKRRKDFSFWDYPLIELDGKTLGIVGFGRIGQALARMAIGFGMDVMYFDTMTYADWEGRATRATLDELLRGSDVISLHCPLFPETQGMINTEALQKMKKGAILLNTSRGPLVVEKDVRAALESGQLGWYSADVVSVEPIEESNPLLGAPNCIITPHIAWAPLESRNRLMAITVANLQSFLDGAPVNVVNP